MCHEAQDESTDAGDQGDAVGRVSASAALLTGVGDFLAAGDVGVGVVTAVDLQPVGVAGDEHARGTVGGRLADAAVRTFGDRVRALGGHEDRVAVGAVAVDVAGLHRDGVDTVVVVASCAEDEPVDADHHHAQPVGCPAQACAETRGCVVRDDEADDGSGDRGDSPEVPVLHEREQHQDHDGRCADHEAEVLLDELAACTALLLLALLAAPVVDRGFFAE